MLRIQRNSDGSLKTNRVAHTADLSCDVCGVSASNLDMNALAYYSDDSINLPCSALSGSCDSVTSWPLVNGTADAKELALVKTA